MTNTQNQVWAHPDTGENFLLAMEEEEYAPIVNEANGEVKKQAIRDLYVRYQAAAASKQTDLSELRGQKFTTALQTAQADLAAWDTMTAAQKTDATKRMLNRQIAIMKVLGRLLS